MQYTQNYHLPQWVKEDRIMMEDFNAMNGSIENGLTQTAAKADTAVSTANAAKQGADKAYTPDNKPYVTGHYTGTGADQVINVGFRPSFAIVAGQGEAPRVGTTAGSVYALQGFSGGNTLTGKIVFTDTGVVIKKHVSDDNYFPILTSQGHIYDYILFR